MGKLCRNTLILLMVSASARAGDEAARTFQLGLKAERAGDIFHAFLLYAQAASLDPKNAAIAERKTKVADLVTHNASIQDATTAPNPDLAFLKLIQSEGPGQFDQFGPTAPAPHLNHTAVKKSFDLNTDAKTTIQKVGEAFGIHVVIDSDYTGPPPFPFRTGELDMYEAFRLLEATTNTLIVPVNGNTALVARDTPKRRAEVVPVVTMAIPIPERFAVQDAQELVTAVQQVLEIRRAAVDPARRMVFLRDAAAKVLMARQLLSDLSRLRSQVEIEVELRAVTKTNSKQIGLTLPNSSALLNFGTFLNNAASPAGFASFLTFGGGKSLFGLGVMTAEAIATITTGVTQSLLSAQVVAVDGQPASLKVGTRYPIATAQFLGATPATTPTATVSFQDLGLVLKITPTVHDEGQVTLDVDAGFTTLGAVDGNGMPAIAQRQFQGKVRLSKNEWAVVAGLAQTTDATSTGGILGLANVPIIGHLFRTDSIEHDSDQTLILLKPRIVNLPPWDSPVSVWDFGTETRPISL